MDPKNLETAASLSSEKARLQEARKLMLEGTKWSTTVELKDCKCNGKNIIIAFAQSEMMTHIVTAIDKRLNEINEEVKNL